MNFTHTCTNFTQAASRRKNAGCNIANAKSMLSEHKPKSSPKGSGKNSCSPRHVVHRLFKQPFCNHRVHAKTRENAPNSHLVRLYSVRSPASRQGGGHLRW